jgi:hypothetical protein
MTTITTTTSRRSSVWRWLGFLMLVLILASAVAAVAGTAMLLHELPADLQITIDGEQVDVGLDAGDALMAVIGISVALLSILVVVPLVLLFGLGVPLLIGALVVLATLVLAGMAIAVVASPLILFGVLLWWALRPRRTLPAQPAPYRPAAPPRLPVVGQHTDNATPLA